MVSLPRIISFEPKGRVTPHSRVRACVHLRLGCSFPELAETYGLGLGDAMRIDMAFALDCSRMSQQRQ